MRTSKTLGRWTELVAATGEVYHDLSLQLGVADSEMEILYALWDGEGELPLPELRRRCGLSKQTVHSALSRLAAVGTVCIRPLDGKNKAVGLTAAGWKKAEETAGRVIRMENDIFESWSQADQEAFLALSARYLEGLRTKTGKAGA